MKGALLLSAALISLLTWIPAPAATPAGTLAPTVIEDLYYGDVLFHYFQDDYFGALTRLRAAQEKNRIVHHDEEAQLLLGGLYLSYGQHLEAGRIFEQLLAGNVAPAVRDRAWFYLGKVWFQRGYWEQAERALREVGRTDSADKQAVRALSPALEAERRNLLAQVLINQGRYEEAIADLRQPLGEAGMPADWNAFARFNLGVALVRAGRLPEAAEMLGAVGTMATTNEEMLALRDKANLALGYAYLQAEQAEQALPVLQRVRLEGAESNKALLAFGWAESAGKRYEEALVPWMELHERSLLDAAVQESYLAIPYAFAQLGADAQAVQFYTAAVQSYGGEVLRIDESIAAIRAGRMLEAIVTADADAARAAAAAAEPGDSPHGPQAQGWFWQLENLPDAPESRYLYHLLAGHQFQEGLKNYRDLGFMRENLDEWARNLEVFDHMLDTRQLAYDQRLPRVEEVLAREDPDGLAERRVQLESRLNAVDRGEDLVALGTEQEQQMWNTIAGMEQYGDALDEDTREKLRLLKGVLYWQLNESFKSRLWSTRRGMKELDLAIQEMQQRWVRVQQARADSPQDNAAFAARIADLGPRIAALDGRLQAAARAQGEYLAALAIDELQRQKERLANYQLQARYALATIYDRAADAQDAP